MAEVVKVTLALSKSEVKAVHKALGFMTGQLYENPVLAEAGGEVYDELTAIVEEE